MAATEKYDIFIENYRGANTDIIFDLSINVLNAEQQPLETLSGGFSSFTIKKTFKSTDSLVYVTSDNSIQIDANTGVVSLSLTVADLRDIETNLEEQTFLYDWDLVDGDGKFFRLLKGSVSFGGDL